MTSGLSTAMVLAAGLGRRMRHLREQAPKPLTMVAGQTLLDHTLDHLASGGITRAIVNVHYMAAMVRTHIEARQRRCSRPEIVISDESDRLLDTGGALVHARPLFGEGPIVVANSDVVRRDRGEHSLTTLWRHFDDRAMDVLLLLHPRDRAVGFDGPGDFFLDHDGRLQRRGAASAAPHLFAGLYVIHPRSLTGAPAEAFSANWLFDRALGERRLFGAVHDGDWMHVGTPEALAAAEAALAARP
ncbi:MAG: nucleotidyltransferase family protein [Alphaproteobacteria bacterium]|nr:nucleotidyltransferase family protein [Alphaproteobacteria bacterium]